jgi:glycosyltransferase involved in cell wall biosynthesis
LRRKIAEQALHNVGILPPLGQREYLSMLSEFDVGIVTLDRRLKTHNLPGKILNYFYWGMPVLASINPGNDLFEILGDCQAGFCCVNGDDERLAAAALRLAEEPELRAQMGRNARRVLEKAFSVQQAARQILAHFDDASLDSRESLDLQTTSAVEPCANRRLLRGSSHPEPAM